MKRSAQMGFQARAPVRFGKRLPESESIMSDLHGSLLPRGPSFVVQHRIASGFSTRASSSGRSPWDAAVGQRGSYWPANTLTAFWVGLIVSLPPRLITNGRDCHENQTATEPRGAHRHPCPVGPLVRLDRGKGAGTRSGVMVKRPLQRQSVKNASKYGRRTAALHI